MTKNSLFSHQQLLDNQQVVEEIRRHLWIESEKAGYDIGFETAARDWLEKFSVDWMRYYLPSQPAEEKSQVKPAVKALTSTDGSLKKAKTVKRSAKTLKPTNGLLKKAKTVKRPVKKV